MSPHPTVVCIGRSLLSEVTVWIVPFGGVEWWISYSCSTALRSKGRSWVSVVVVDDILAGYGYPRMESDFKSVLVRTSIAFGHRDRYDQFEM